MGSEIVVDILIVAAFLSAAWIFTGRGEDANSGHALVPGWKRLPSVFRFTWGFSTLFERSVGISLSNVFKKRAESFRLQAVAASLPLTAPRVFASSCAVSLLCVIVSIVLAGGVWVANPQIAKVYLLLPILLMGIVGWFLPVLCLTRYTEERQSLIMRELPFAIDLMGAAMRAGLDFGAAMRYYVMNASPGPLVDELKQVLDTTLGRPLTQSLNDMAARIRIESFTSFAGVVAYGYEIGAPIAKTLKVHGEDMRRKRFHLAEQKAAKAPSVMIIPLVLFLMPSVFIIVMTPMFLRMSTIFTH